MGFFPHQDEPEGELPMSRSLQLMNSLIMCLLVTAVRAQFGSGNLICIIVILRYFLVQLVLTLRHFSNSL